MLFKPSYGTFFNMPTVLLDQQILSEIYIPVSAHLKNSFPKILKKLVSYSINSYTIKDADITLTFDNSFCTSCFCIKAEVHLHASFNIYYDWYATDVWLRMRLKGYAAVCLQNKKITQHKNSEATLVTNSLYSTVFDPSKKEPGMRADFEKKVLNNIMQQLEKIVTELIKEREISLSSEFKIKMAFDSIGSNGIDPLVLYFKTDFFDKNGKAIAKQNRSVKFLSESAPRKATRAFLCLPALDIDLILSIQFENNVTFTIGSESFTVTKCRQGCIEMDEQGPCKDPTFECNLINELSLRLGLTLNNSYNVEIESKINLKANTRSIIFFVGTSIIEGEDELMNHLLKIHGSDPFEKMINKVLEKIEIKFFSAIELLGDGSQRLLGYERTNAICLEKVVNPSKIVQKLTEQLDKLIE